MNLPNDIQIRKAKATDLNSVLEVMRPWNMHHVPSPEMPSIDLECFFVAVRDGEIVGAAGYKMLSNRKAKTTLLGVIPALNGTGIGKALQLARMDAIYSLGVKYLETNADRPEIIAWYERNFGYKQIGRVDKVMSFGDPNINYWATLETDLETFFRISPHARKFANVTLQTTTPRLLVPINH